MPSLTEKLKSLGIEIGTQNLPSPKPTAKSKFPIDSVLPGEWWQTRSGDTFFVETRYKADNKIGNTKLRINTSLEAIAEWAREPRLKELDLDQFAFIDTETTGLAGGTGTYTFLIGIGRFEKDEFRLAQFFLTDPGEETAQLAAFSEFLEPCEAVVTYNGKSFDVPLINTRFIINGWPSPLSNTAHLDLLHLARRLWKNRLTTCTLGDLETHILGMKRSEQDVPGWMISDLYFDYLHTGDSRPLRGVFYHNEIDVVSLAVLMNKMSQMIANPMGDAVEFGLDIISIGKLYADIGQVELAAEIYQHGLNYGDLDGKSKLYAIKQLSMINKKLGDIKSAIIFWEEAAQKKEIYAHEELAKFFEHKEKDIESALHWTRSALNIIYDDNCPSYERGYWEGPFKHREQRLLRKLSTTK
jgi:uncharacterized protein YprB with RNaseH-like and TPR domain